MMELKGFEAPRVTTLDALAAVRFHKFALTGSTPLSERSSELFASAITPSAVEILRSSERRSRCVVSPEG